MSYILLQGDKMCSDIFDYNDYYKKVSHVYNDIRLDSPNDFQNTINVILENMNPGMKNILDVGCGTGKYGEALVQLGFNVEGIDKSPTQIAEAKKIINAQQGNVVKLPYGEKSFDVCTMIMMIHHLTDEERQMAFDEVYRILREDGILIIKTASHEDLKYRISSSFFPEAFQIDLERYPAIETIQEELVKFKKYWIKHSISTTSFNKEDMKHKLSMRRTSNLGMLSENALQVGINRFIETYQNQEIIEKENYNTFIIAQK